MSARVIPIAGALTVVAGPAAACLPGDLALFSLADSPGHWVAAWVTSVDAYGNPMGVLDGAGLQVSLAVIIDDPAVMTIAAAKLIGDVSGECWRLHVSAPALLAALGPYRAPP